MGDIPQTDEDWKYLESEKIHTVFNFSPFSLGHHSGFTIISIPPDLISLTQPMTEKENAACIEFSNIIKQISNSTRLYIAGNWEHTLPIAHLLALKNSKNIKLKEKQLDIFQSNLIEKYSDR